MASFRFFGRDRWTGLIAYPAGDTIAQIIMGDPALLRVAAMAIVGGPVYAFEIPRWFAWIDRRFPQWWARTIAAIVYFNPLWIARHLLVITLSTAGERLTETEFWRSAIVDALSTGTRSFAGAIVLSAISNYLIQNPVPLRHRFLASAIFSGLMAVYYALSQVYWSE
jgi:hypothetical protein